MRTPKWKFSLYLAILLFGIITALPNLFTPAQLEKLPGWLPKNQITLGLDLRGGSHLVLEVDSGALIKERLESLATDSRTLLREIKAPARTVRVLPDGVVITLIDPARHESAVKKLAELNTSADTMGFGKTAAELDILPQENGAIRLNLTEAGIKERIDSALAQSLEIVRRRIDQVGVAEPTIQRVGDDRILVQLPGLQDPSHLRKLLGSTAKMTFHLLAEDAAYAGGKAGPGVSMLPDIDGTTSYPVQNKVMLSGDRLTDAQAGLNPQSGLPIVSFRFDSAGARQFAKVTTENVGRPFAIVLDGKVLSAPVIQEPITGGSGQISGNFTLQETAMLSALLRAGALPAPLTVIEERTVGPDLGSDAIAMGIKAGLIGFGLVFIFMLFLYGRWGLIANFALALNVVLTFAVLSLLGATLTLPGIAGIILGIGLAVDANILINERIREETEKGRNGYSALDAGFNRAYATIIDSNVTGLIATALLYYFGTGPVKGFAVTMGLGIATSMFTAVSVVKVIMTELVHRYRIKDIKIKPLIDLFPQDTNIKFMNARFFGIGVSFLLSIASVILFFAPGLNYGVDFKGGIQMEVATEEPADLSKFRSSLQSLGLGEIALQEFGSDHSVLIRAERRPGGEEEQTKAVEAIKEAVRGIDAQASFERVEVVGPKVSGELAVSGILAVISAALCMLFYIWWRFEWPFAVGAIVTLTLDITKTVGFFALTGLDFNLTAVAAILTLIGYSVNDKVVVYDRMRENMRLYKSMSLRDLIDKSINQTLARSLYTSVTAFLAMLPMAIWGGSAVESFAIPMVFGIIIAASSSVFIAAPILLFLGDWRDRRKARIEGESPSRNGKTAT
ncbi:MAG: protein translocase subunit SecD [Alphaproteobacteria bacterium]|nr:protein translocase subunit SecD [Alphaproteobacteria bacterium]